MLKRFLLVSIATLSLVHAQTLQQSVKKVLETNPIVLERLANYRETAKDLSIARSEYLPTLDLSSGIGHEKTDNKNSHILAGKTALEYYENSLTLMLNIFDGFGTWNKVDYQKSRIIASAYNFIEKSDDTAFEMTRRYIEALKQRELLLTAKENVSINEKIFVKVKDLYTNGLTTKSEVRKIESSLYLARANLVVQENNTMDAVYNFKKVLGEELDIETLEVPKFDVMLPKTLNEAIAYSMRNNPSIIVSNNNIKASQYLKDQRSKNYYPKIDLMVQQNLDSNTFGLESDRNRFRAGVVLTYNLYRGGADSDEIAKSTSSIYRNVQTRNELQRETIEGLELSWSAYTMTNVQLDELIKYKNFSKETLNLYKEEYDIGRRTLLDLLSAQNDFINSKSQIIRAKYDFLFAQYRILDSMGLLVAGIMGNDYKYMQKVGITGVDAVDNEDMLPVSYDLDKDNLASMEDECPSSLSDAEILANGCAKLSDIYSEVKSFDLLLFNRDVELISSHEKFNTIIDTIKSKNEKMEKVFIQSHSSLTNDTQEDFELSKAYAEMVKKSFVDAGIDAKKIRIELNGANVPISTDESLNNRVNVIIYLK